jgi:glycosyltransferase involved in cell wall biosynthesis
MEPTYPVPTQDYTVIVKCFTYNHEKYIEDTLKGFVMQKTTFPFVCLIIDDCSTDHTADIVRKYEAQYPDIIKGFYLDKNHYSLRKPKYPYIKSWRVRSQFEAICEGDDYWIDPLKLQKQIDFLEQHPDYAMCFHPVYYERNLIKETTDQKGDLERDFSTDEIIKGGGDFCATCSIVFRRDVLPKYPSFSKLSATGDYFLQIMSSLIGKVHYLPDIMGVYRKFTPGSWTARKKNGNVKNLRAAGIEWKIALDDYTNHQYQSSIYYVIVGNAMPLFSRGIISKKLMKEYISKVNPDTLTESERKLFNKQCFIVAHPKLFNFYKRLSSLLKR